MPGVGFVVALLALLMGSVFYIIGMPRNATISWLLAGILALVSIGGLD